MSLTAARWVRDVDTGVPTDSADEIARLVCRLEMAEHERELVGALRAKALEGQDELREEIRSLEREVERLRADVRERDVLLTTIFGSRSWKVAQGVRRVLGRR